MKQGVIDLLPSVVVEKDVENKIRTVGVKGLDFEKAKELGVFTRISNLLCVVHATIMASKRVYSGVEVMMEAIRSNRNEIAREMNAFDKAYNRFINFWTDYYAKGTIGTEVDGEVETLFNNIMAWSQIPYQWNLGDAQRTDPDVNSAIRITDGSKFYNLEKTVIDGDVLSNTEYWCVMKYDVSRGTQVCVEDNMDKASAMMVAKRLSSDDSENLYVPCQIQEVTKKETIVTPIKAYRKNETIGKITKTLK